MEKSNITAELIQKTIADLRVKFATDPIRLKFVEANALLFSRERNEEKRNESFAAFLGAINNPETDFTNPLFDQQVDIKGFAALLADIKDYESDTFSASGVELSEAEVVLIANQLVENWKESHLDGVQIAAILDDIRADDEFGLELRGSAKKQ